METSITTKISITKVPDSMCYELIFNVRNKIAHSIILSESEARETMKNLKITESIDQDQLQQKTGKSL